jgi:putative methyltransferase (TIGR04325 family)
MNMSGFRAMIRKFLPEPIIRAVSGVFYGWHGNFASWNEASAKCPGYEAEAILERVKKSALLVKSGEAVYERDSFLFDEVQYSYPVLSSLMWIGAINKGNLHVLDFGGSLGSTYYQNRKFLDQLPEVSWSVVEQPGFVKAGKENFEDDRLHFFNNISDVCESAPVNVAIFSSVLQYLEEPFLILEQIRSCGIKYLIIDRTPFITGEDRITIQKVNPRIYHGSYPCRFFNKQKFISALAPYYDLVIEFDALDQANIKSEFKGFLFSLKK